jgi:membrane peptidoglycan carboxypeptidase
MPHVTPFTRDPLLGRGRWHVPAAILIAVAAGLVGSLALRGSARAPSPAVPGTPRDAATSAPLTVREDTHGPPTREVALEHKLNKMLADGRTPFAATVLLEIGSGRVIAVAEHSTRGAAAGLAQRPMAPAASIFKIVTSSALLQAGVRTHDAVCSHGGTTRMTPTLLVDNPRRDTRCATFGDVVPRSLNVAIAKLALKHLDPDRLRAEAARWGFGEPLLTMQPSVAAIPDDPFAFANAAAGFGDVKMSALHGAMIAAAVAQEGLLIVPRFYEVDDESGPTAWRATPPAVARALKRMMIDTVDVGTARRAFSQAPRLAAGAGGKTGSLADYQTGLDTSWFVGFAPAEHPAVAVASVVVNDPVWHVKAPAVAKEALRAYFVAHPPPPLCAAAKGRTPMSSRELVARR